MTETQNVDTFIEENQKNEVGFKRVKIGDESYFKISNHNLMRPFFMSIVSDSNHWMFISSNGGLTAGRKNAEYALFPYYTDDKITESFDTTGSKTILQITKNGATHIWEPYSNRNEGRFEYSRHLYKNLYGNKILFEEINHDLGISYRYEWSSSNQFGFIKESTIINHSGDEVYVRLLDGIQNIMPYGVTSDIQGIRSNLVDAYKRNELAEDVGLGIFALSSIIVDRAEPSEALKANIAWSIGLDSPTYLLSSSQLNNFRKGEDVRLETDVKAEKGAYFVSQDMTLLAEAERSWMIVANVNQGPANVAEISEKIRSNKRIEQGIREDIEIGTQRLIRLVAASDGLQYTADKKRNARHFSNTLFNIMRGGIFDDNYTIEKWDFSNYLKQANKKCFQSNSSLISQLSETFSLQELRALIEQSEDAAFTRLALEYMPLKFSRRHGDPSRPWNKFSINTRNEVDGTKILDYEGNWRDIFQNWEALAHSYPEFIENMILKFLNASTFDGYNPYRVTKDGFDWEVIEPHDPWSYIGYWGDHQIIYLLKFLEFIQDYYPNRLASFFNEDLFVYANVPYRIKPYQDLLADPKDTILFDEALDLQIRKRREEQGGDGALIHGPNNEIYRVNFIEKILATSLAKLSNFIPEAGIWLNTQRPEWNDANNALVGNGVSMVTLYYLRRFFSFFQDLLSSHTDKEVQLSQELLTFFKSIQSTFDNHKDLLSGNISDEQRKRVLDGLGKAGSAYRDQIYDHGFSGQKASFKLDELTQFIETVLSYLDHTIDANLRSDGMYHAYNLMTVEGDNAVSISYLEEMLEGQVAALSSGYLSGQSVLSVLDSMKGSPLFREDQYSYLLYPNKELPGFLSRNVIPGELVASSSLLNKLVEEDNRQIIVKDINGVHHFNGNFKNANDLKEGLEALKQTHDSSLIDADSRNILDIFEKVFNHKAFTGRSGTFYGYEGLGSIYWHMVSKLLLAVEECCLRAVEANESDEIVGRLLEHYYEINEGIGVHKSPQLYGAFPIDPYSHTPFTKGAQQPGMTGQVKEDILSRKGELGVFVNNGQIHFNPSLLLANEFIQESKTFSYINMDREEQDIELTSGMIAFTYCQVPVTYSISDVDQISITHQNGDVDQQEGLQLSAEVSSKIFTRSGLITQINVFIKQEHLK